MGKSLVIKGADFSANGIPESLPPLDITAIVRDSSRFHPGNSIGSLYSTTPSPNTKRCCIVATRFLYLGIDISQYTKIEVTIKSGYDYVFGTGIAPDVADGWQGWDGETGGQSFAWVTGNQKGIATVDNTTLSFTLNLRYDDNTTEFSESTVLTDIVDSIVLVP